MVEKHPEQSASSQGSEDTSENGTRRLWERSFESQIQQRAYNTAPVEALVRSVSYYLRDRFPESEPGQLRFLEMGCGAGPNLRWLARRGVRVSGVDISPTALDLARQSLENAGCSELVEELLEGSVVATPFPDESFDGVIEACVFQHLSRDDRRAAFGEVGRLLKPGGLFVGYMLDRRHTVFQAVEDRQLPEDPGTVHLDQGGSRLHLEDIGLAHFFAADEFAELLEGFAIVDPCWTAYELPRSESEKRGHDTYLQSMWTVFAIK